MVTDMRSGLFFSAVFTVLMLATGINGQSASGVSPVSRSQQWLTGSELHSRLRGNIKATWSESPLPRVLAQISASQQVAFFLDRRVDKGLLVEYSQTSGSVFQAIDQILSRSGLAGIWVGDVYYIAAPQHVATLAMERERFNEETSRLRGEAGRWWSDTRPWSWPELSQPAELIEEHFTEQVAAPETAPLPHDLWPAFDGPELARSDMLLLLLNGFGLAPETAKGKRGAWSLRPVTSATGDEAVNYRIEIPDDIGQKSSELLEELRESLPDVKLDVRGREMSAKGRPIELVALIRLLDLKRFAQREDTALKGESKKSGNSKKVVSLKQQGPIIDILKACARNLEVSLEFDESLKAELGKRIEIDVSRVTYEELIAETLKGTDLTWQLDGTRLRILRKE